VGIKNADMKIASEITMIFCITRIFIDKKMGMYSAIFHTKYEIQM